MSVVESEESLDTAVDGISAALTLIKVIAKKFTTKASFPDLPSEILLIIFTYTCQTGENWEALSLSCVCIRWRTILLADPAFWSHISLVIPDRDPYDTPPLATSALLRMAKLTKLYLERSEDSLLSATIKMPTRFKALNSNTPWYLYISVAAISFLQGASNRIQHLCLCVDHGLLHDFAYADPCSQEIDSEHNRPCSQTIYLPNLISLSVDYVSRNATFFPFTYLPKLIQLSLSHEGFYFFHKQSSPALPDLKLPRLTTFTISYSSGFGQLCRMMALTNATTNAQIETATGTSMTSMGTKKGIKQVVLANMPSLDDLVISSHTIAQAIFPEISALRIVDSPDGFISTFCKVFQFSGLKEFELVYRSPSPSSPPFTADHTHASSIWHRSASSTSTSSTETRIAWTDLARDIICFIRRCPMIQTVTLRNHSYSGPDTSTKLEVVREICFEPGISPSVRIVGFPLYPSHSSHPIHPVHPSYSPHFTYSVNSLYPEVQNVTPETGTLSANEMMDYLLGFDSSR